MLRVEIEQFQNTVTLRCSGRLVQGDGLEQLRRTVMSETAKHLILDLSDVSSIDAGGLGELVELRQWAIDSARTFTVLNPSERVRELVVATNLQFVLDVTTTSEESSNAAVAGSSSSIGTLPAAVCAADL